MNALGLVTAAGKSTRMGGFPKPLLTFAGQRFVERILDQYDQAGVVTTVVVLGHEAQIVETAIDWGETTVVTNENFESGMLSSVQAGVAEAMKHDCEGLFLWPTDYACVPAGIVTKLWEAYTESDADIVSPVYHDERGHPALFGESTFEQLLTAPEDEGARAVVYDPETVVEEVPVNDPRVLVDIDTPEEYWEAVKRYELDEQTSSED